jgi:hypothetical protein
MRHQSRALWLRTPRWSFQERVRSRSTSMEMWITGCGNYDFWPDQIAPADRLRRRLCPTVSPRFRGSASTKPETVIAWDRTGFRLFWGRFGTLRRALLI